MKLLLLDTSILIDHFRKVNRGNSRLSELMQEGMPLAVSVVTVYEFCLGVPAGTDSNWDSFFANVTIFPLTEKIAHCAVELQLQLKRKSQQLDCTDIFIAATAVTHGLQLETLNHKHFPRIDALDVR